MDPPPSSCRVQLRVVCHFGNGDCSHLLLICSGSVLVEGGQVTLLLFGAHADSLRVALDGLLILASLEILVALVLGSLGPVQGALHERDEGHR